MKKLLITLMMFLPLSVCAMDSGGYFKISSLSVWGGYANGAVLIRLEQNNTTCPGGYWFQDSSNSGSKNLLSTVLSAYHAKTPIKLYADEASDFWGLASKECELQLEI